MHTERPAPAASRGSGAPRVIVGAAIIVDRKVLACARAHPPELAGLWEFPGGKVEPGESETAALVRECEEELGVHIAVGDRIGADIPLGHRHTVLKIFAARLVDGEPSALEHAELRWLARDDLDDVPWLPADAPIVTALREGPWLLP